MDNNQLSFEAAKTIYNSSNNKEVLEALETVFPQLRENEDEKIRKEILHFIKKRDRSGCDYDYDKWIAWLEKQGDNNNEDADILQRFSFYSYKDEPNVLYLSNVFVNEEYRNKGIGTKILKIADEVSTYLKCNSICLKTENGSNAESLYRKNGYKTLKEEGNQIWLEKQGEKLPVGFYYVNSEGKKFYSDTFKYGDLTLHVENQDEQKTDNKPELKFAVNDWVVNKYGDIWHIDSLDKKNYRVSNKGRYNYFPIAKQGEMHLWTIEDAKPGDLLFISTKQRNYWAMFKEYDDNNKFIFFYCYICGNFNIGGFVPIDCINKINPLPFSPHSGRFYNTMKKAGYEWNDLNNKLVNINPDLQKFYTGDWVICTDQGGYEHVMQIAKVEIFTPSYDSKQYYRYWTSDLTWFGDSYDARLWTINDAKDGDVLATSAGAFIYNGNNGGGSCLGCYCGINTLGKFQIGVKTHWTGKSVFPATKEQRDTLFSKMKEAGYEWDNEKKELKKIEQKSQRMVSAEAKEALYDKPTDEEMKELLRTEYEKGRADTIAEMKKDWSEEDEKMLEGIVNTVKDIRCQSLLSEIEIYDDYIDWLKSLKDRYTWKPSNEQIDAFENLVRSYGESGTLSPYDNHTKILYSLLYNLKNLNN